MRLLALTAVPFLLHACGSSSSVRQPTPDERREIIAVAKWVYEYESDLEPYRPTRLGLDLHLDTRPTLKPKVVAVRVSRAEPRFASAVVELRDAEGRRGPGTALLILERVPKRDALLPSAPWGPVELTTASPVRQCARATPKPLRDLVCPDPWSVLGYPRPRVRLNRAVTMEMRSADIREVDWGSISLPGAACGATEPIGLENGHSFVRSAVFPWWPAVAVSSAWDGVRYGDLEGDGKEEAVVEVVCSNAGGTASGQLAFASVIFAMRGQSLRSIGIITPRQPLDVVSSHVPLVRSEIRRGQVIAQEYWYGAGDGSCCASGRARTTWTHTGGRLVPGQTVVLREPTR